MLEKYLKEKYEIAQEEEQIINEAKKTMNGWEISFPVTVDSLIDLVDRIIKSEGVNKSDAAIVFADRNEEELRVLNIYDYLTEKLSKLSIEEETGEIDAWDITESLMIVSRALIEAISRAKGRVKDSLEYEQRRYLKSGTDEGYDFAWAYNQIWGLYRSWMDKKILSELKKMEKEIKVKDLEKASKEKIIQEFETWKNSPLGKYEDLLIWLSKGIESIEAMYPAHAEQSFLNDWAVDLKSIGIDPSTVGIVSSQRRWGFGITINLNKQCFERLKEDAKTNERAKNVLTQLLNAETPKRKNQTTWEIEPVLQNNDNVLSGNTWVIELLGDLEEVVEEPMVIGKNPNRDPKFSFIE